MNTPLLHGLYLAAANLLLNLVLYLAGMHDSVETLKSTQGAVGFASAGLCAVIVALAIREKRALTPGDAAWGYGSALGTGVLTVLFGTVIGIITSYVYYAFINPGLSEIFLQMQIAQAEANGTPPAQMAEIETTMRRFMSPGMIAVFGAFFSFFLGTVVALITAIFFRNRAQGVATVP